MSQATIGVVGLGLLGRGIAACFLSHGYSVVAYTPTQAEHATTLSQIDSMMKELVEKAGFKPEACDPWRRRYKAVTDFAPLADCEFVVESVPEDAATKEEVYQSLESVLSPAAVIASNTSAIPIGILQQRRRKPERMVGMHWAEPAHMTRFVELVRGEKTGDAAFNAAADLARKLGKDPSLCLKDVPGFIVNRIGYAMYREACHLIDTGVATPETIDRSIRNTLGLWATLCGPLRWIDLSGGPLLYAKAMRRVLPTLCNSAEIPASLAKLAAEGARGIVNGHGFYDYTPEEARYWRELHHRHAREAQQTIDRHFPIQEEIK